MSLPQPRGPSEGSHPPGDHIDMSSPAPPPPSGVARGKRCPPRRIEGRQGNFFARRPGGKVPDDWWKFCPTRYAVSLAGGCGLAGLLPCKTFLHENFDDGLQELAESDLRPDLECVKPWRVADVRGWQEGVVSAAPEVSAPPSLVPGKPPLILPTSGLVAKLENGDKSKIVAVINLCATERYYSPEDVRELGLEHFWIKVEGGGELPSMDICCQFLNLLKYLGVRYPGGFVAVHCTHGVNRTGFFVSLALCKIAGYSPSDAVTLFEVARGHQMTKMHFVEALGKIAKVPHLERRQRVLSVGILRGPAASEQSVLLLAAAAIGWRSEIVLTRVASTSVQPPVEQGHGAQLSKKRKKQQAPGLVVTLEFESLDSEFDAVEEELQRRVADALGANIMVSDPRRWAHFIPTRCPEEPIEKKQRVGTESQNSYSKPSALSTELAEEPEIYEAEQKDGDDESAGQPFGNPLLD